MYNLAEAILSLSLFLCLALAAVIFSKPVAGRLTQAININQWLRNFCLIITAGLLACLIILLAALVKADYGLAYCLGRTSPTLSLHFRASALWAGAEGSLLLWATATAIASLLFQYTRFYESLSQATALYFWGFFYLILAFFLFLLSTYSQPFITEQFGEIPGHAIIESAQAGLNPVLRHPAMVIHPPLIFLGYATLAVPACLALARLLSGPGIVSDTPALRAFLLTAWAFISAGIILGMCWAYTESSWGGYWTWDAVENSSLMPWIALTAALLSNHFEQKRNKIFALNSLLCALPLTAAFLATYIVRSGVLASKHSYNLGNWSLCLLIFTALPALLAATGFYFSPKRSELTPLLSREGLILFQIFLLFALGLTIMLGTLWPWITATFSEHSLRLENSFYVNTCLPILILLLLNMLLAPLISWDGLKIEKGKILILLLTALATGTGLYLAGFHKPQALPVASLCGALLASVFLSRPGGPACRLIYAGVAVMIFGIAMSAAYKEEWQIALKPGQSAQFGQWEVSYEKLDFWQNEFAFARLEINLTDGSGQERPIWLEQRAYGGKQVFAETGFAHGIANDLGFSILQLHKDHSALIKIVNSLFVNLIWLGGALMCLAIFPAWLCKRGEQC